MSTLPLALNAVAEWRTLDTSSIARLFPFSPPDLDTRSGTLYGIDMRACAPVVYDPWDGTHLNANTAVLARSGSGKSFATKLGMLRGLCRGVTAYVIDPEGEYADMARAAGGRVLSPGVPGQGMNPFVIGKGDSEELLQRIGSLRRLIEVMVGESLGAERRASLDHALAGYYAQPRERTGFRDFYAYLQESEAGDHGVTLMARCLDDEVVRGQLSAHYPQARIRKVDPGDDPLRLGEGEQAWSMTLRADGPEYVPLRTFRDDDLLDPGSDPLIALMGALSALEDDERVVARLLLRSLGPDWSQPHLEKAHKRPGMEPREPAYTFQTKPLQMDGVTMAVLGIGALAALKGYLWVQDGEIWKAAPPGDGNGPGAARRRLGVVAVEEGPQARRGPHPDWGEGLPHRLRRRASGHGDHAGDDPAPACRRAPGAGGRRLPPLRQPRRGAHQGRQGPARRARPGHAAPVRPRTVRRAQRPGRPRGRLPVAPARSGRRDAPGGAVRREGAPALCEGRQGRRAGGGHHGGQAPAHPLPRRPAPPPPPLRRTHSYGQVHPHAPPRRPQDEGEGRGQGQRTPSWWWTPTPTWSPG